MLTIGAAAFAKWTYTTKDGKTHTLRTSSTYGHGMIDLDAATKPLGELEIPTGVTTSSGVKSISDSKFVFSKKKFLKSDLLNKNLMVLDDYDRGSYASKDAFFLYRRIPTLRGEAERLGEALGEKLRNALKGDGKA